LRQAQAILDGDESQLIDWITFFWNCLVQQQNILELKLNRERLMAPLSPLSAMLIKVVEEHGRLTVRDAASLTEANRNTIKLHFKQLVDAGRLVRCGRGKGTWYEKP
jgi:predicted HTH transcriptional regulator